jgi:hypothetical protein
MLNQIINPMCRMIQRQPVPKIRGQQHWLILVITPYVLFTGAFVCSGPYGLLGDIRLRHTPFSCNPKSLRVTDTRSQVSIKPDAIQAAHCPVKSEEPLDRAWVS